MQRCCSRLLRPLAAAGSGCSGGSSLSSAHHRFPPILPFLPRSTARRRSPSADPPLLSASQPFLMVTRGVWAFIIVRFLYFRFCGFLALFTELVNWGTQMMQKRDYAAKEKSRAPATPVTSKVKKYKIKGYASFKSRFRIMNDGNIRRWRAGKRHNAHLKSKKSKRRLRQPAIVPLAYAKVMKKLHFCS